jgi:hypothetical protein
MQTRTLFKSRPSCLIFISTKYKFRSVKDNEFTEATYLLLNSRGGYNEKEASKNKLAK